MKKLFYILSVCLFAIGVDAQTTQIPALSSDVVLPLEQEPYQQLIGYALEVTNFTFEQSKPMGKYHCEDIFSMDGYTAITEFPCEVIVHSDVGPIVVRYKGINDETSALIDAFLTDNLLKDQIRYNKGRFRFSFEEVKEDKTSATKR